MGTLTIPEFNDYLRTKKPTVIIYDDENNSEYKRGYVRHAVCQPSYISLIFNHICTYNRAVILKSGSGYIRLNNIEKIDLKLTASPLGEIATLYCKNEDYSTAYTLIIR